MTFFYFGMYGVCFYGQVLCVWRRLENDAVVKHRPRGTNMCCAFFSPQLFSIFPHDLLTSTYRGPKKKNDFEKSNFHGYFSIIYRWVAGCGLVLISTSPGKPSRKAGAAVHHVRRGVGENGKNGEGLQRCRKRGGLSGAIHIPVVQ